MNPSNGFAEQLCDAQLGDFLALLSLDAQWHGVAHDHLLQLGLFDSRNGGTVEESMRSERKHSRRAAFRELRCRLGERPGGVNHIIDENDVASVDVTDEVHSLDGVGLEPLLHNHR